MLKKISFVVLVLFLMACNQKQGEADMDNQNNTQETIQVAVVKTNMGTFEIELYADKTPKTVTNFVTLAKENFYDSLTFHRIIDGFMIQGGDPTGMGSGGKSIYGEPFEDEFVPGLAHDSEGILSMANRGPNTNTSQFFITLDPQPHLNGLHTVFGKVIKGMETVRAIGKVPTQPPYNKPVEPVIMEDVLIETRAK